MDEGRDSERDDLDGVRLRSGGPVVEYQVTLPPVNLWNYTKIDYWRNEMTDKKTEALKLIDLLVKQDILTKHETNLLREALAEQPAQQQEPWVGLTDEEMNAALDYWSEDERSAYGGAHAADEEYVSMIDTWRYIEAKLKEKNT